MLKTTALTLKSFETRPTCGSCRVLQLLRDIILWLRAIDANREISSSD